MNREHFRIGDCVVTRSQLRPFKSGIILPSVTTGYITALYANMAIVEFAILGRSVAVKYADLRIRFTANDRAHLHSLRCTGWDGRIAWFSI